MNARLDNPHSLGEVLERAASNSHSDDLRFFGPNSETAMSYSDLLQEARKVLSGLREAGLKKGDLLPLIHRNIEDFLPGFWACQLGGLVAIPLAPPFGRNKEEEQKRLEGVLQKSGASMMLCDEESAALINSLGYSPGTAPTLLKLEELRQAPAADDFPKISGDDLAMVQFSSGSTRTPQGVMLSHANLLANMEQMASRVPLDDDTIELGWMPHYHDMGLIGCHLTPLWVGARQLKLAPEEFLRRPLRWLDIASEHKATLLSATETSLRLLLRKLRDVDVRSWDLTHVQALMVGAEPISAGTIRSVAETLAPTGLRPETLRGAYGLAEASVGVALPSPERGHRFIRIEREALAQRQVVAAKTQDEETPVTELMVIGKPLDDCEIRLVDDEDIVIQGHNVGHLQVRGPNV
ncbi:AMP-binding protein, partial [Myxococcota bacterium]|nr:AMP-binding protein [Myxococcota bacterium]